MSDVNKAIIIGRLGADPEVRYTGNGVAVCNFRVATGKKWKGKDGQMQEKTEWHRVVAWDKLGENCGKFLAKGRQVYVEGEIETRKWEDKEGHERYTTEIKAFSVVFLGGASDKADTPQEQKAQASAAASDDDSDPFDK